MIARNLINHPENLLKVIGTAFPVVQIEINLSERSGSLLPSRRDREVPYGMKGGEQNGH